MTDDGRTVSFYHPGGNEWWVEVYVQGADATTVSTVEARGADGAWTHLTKQSWGAWATSFHIEPGSDVRFRATWGDGDQVLSCWFAHPSGVERCEGVTDDRLAAATYVSMANGGFERTTDVVIDAGGNAYVAGNSGPGQWEHHDAFIAKYHPDGALAWRRVIAGNGADLAHTIDLDQAGNLYVGGVTESTNLPVTGWQTTNGGLRDGWVAKLSPSGAIQWATLIGGSRNDHVHAIGVDSVGAVTAAGFTNSCDFPTYGPAFQTASPECTGIVDGFVTRLTPDGSSAVHSTLYGGSGPGTDIIEDLVSERDGTVHIVGRTESPDLPMTANAAQAVHGGHTDAFYARFSPLSQLEYATFLGGSQDDRARGVTLDGAGGAVLTGESGSPAYPTTAGSVQPHHSGGMQCIRVLGGGPDPETEPIPCQDLVVTRINEAGDIAYSTFFGTQTEEEGHGIARDAAGGLHVTGRLYRDGALPGEHDPIGPGGGYSDAFLVSIAADGASVTRSVRLGGTDGDFGEQTAIAPDGSLWLVGWTWSPDMPTTAGAAQRSLNGMEDGYLARFAPPSQPSALTFDHRGGNEWWVQVRTTGDAPERVQAMDTGGQWKELAFKDWGDWASSFHIEPGHDVRFRAMFDATWHESCWFTHPGGKTPDGGETCSTSGEEPPPPPPPSGDFDATFGTSGGNEWWVEVRVDANEPLARVDARDDGGAWIALEKKSWGAWAKSFHVQDGSLVDFRATSSDGDIDISGQYRWPAGTQVTREPDEGSGDDPPPPSSEWYTETFWGMQGNEWWVEIRVDSPVTGVDARADGGEWHPLTLREWGAWAGSFHIPDGSLVQFRAHRTDGAMGFHAQGFPWPDGTPPYPGWGNAGAAFDAAFHNVKGNADYQQVNVYATWNLDGVQLSINGGAWTEMQRQPWGDWAASMHINPGSTVQFRAYGGGGADASQPVAWPPT